jgi:hypothetical protein
MDPVVFTVSKPQALELLAFQRASRKYEAPADAPEDLLAVAAVLADQLDLVNAPEPGEETEDKAQPDYGAWASRAKGALDAPTSGARIKTPYKSNMKPLNQRSFIQRSIEGIVLGSPIATVPINLIVLTYLNLFGDDALKIRFVFCLLLLNGYRLALYCFKRS